MLFTRVTQCLFAAVLLLSDVSPKVRAAQPAVVVGFVGGFVHHDDPVHQEVQLAAHLRQVYPSGVAVEMFANSSGRLAHREILRLLDNDGDGILSPAEKSGARVVLFGHSWGASETVATARRLEKDGIPVLLTIQVDSVSKPGSDDRTIPANVAQAVNFYQLDGMLHGEREILAADPAKTQILGNFRLHYKTHSANPEHYPWYARLFMRPHIEIESDPAVWNRIESLVRATLSSK
jgi:hypothetical protein